MKFETGVAAMNNNLNKKKKNHLLRNNNDNKPDRDFWVSDYNQSKS